MAIKQAIFQVFTYHIENLGFYADDREELISELQSFMQLMPNNLVEPWRMYEIRQQKAIAIIHKILEKNDKAGLMPEIAQLAEVERQTQELQPTSRDHVVHALNTFLLGEYIYKQFMDPVLSIYIEPFQWKICGLLHDVGYPLQIGARSLINPFINTINSIKRGLGSKRPDIVLNMQIIGLTDLGNNKNSFQLLQSCINNWDLEIDVRYEYDQMILSNNICHGILSALTVLYLIDLMYEEYNPTRTGGYYPGPNGSSFDQYYFENFVVEACAAIFIHNLPHRCFRERKISPIKAPLAFLLKLSDTLQEWERPFKGNLWGIKAENFEIVMENNNLVFRTEIESSRNSIMSDICNTLDSTGIRIEG